MSKTTNTKTELTKTAIAAIKCIGPSDKKLLQTLQSSQEPDAILTHNQIRWLCYHILQMNGCTFEGIEDAANRK